LRAGSALFASAMAKAASPDDRVACEIVAEVLRSGRKVMMRLDGTSMIPAIWPRDMVEIVPCGPGDAHEGLIAVFIRQGRLIAHRIVRVERREALQFVTRGDAIAHDDPPIDACQLLGYVSAVVRDERREPVSTSPRFRAKILSSMICKSRIARRLILSAMTIYRPYYSRAI
jgi:hypothetical protein